LVLPESAMLCSFAATLPEPLRNQFTSTGRKTQALRREGIDAAHRKVIQESGEQF
jgi:hypothetical protein